MTSRITDTSISSLIRLASQHRVAAARQVHSDEPAAAAAAPRTAVHTRTEPKDRGELSTEQREVLKEILSTPLKAEPKDSRFPTLEFTIPSILHALRKRIRHQNNSDLKIFDTFLFIGSGVTSCINKKFKPSDLDILLRRHFRMTKEFFDSIKDKKAYFKSHLDGVRDMAEDVFLDLFETYDSSYPMNIREIFRNYVKKACYHNDELKAGESRSNRWGMLHFGDQFELKFEITITIVDQGKVIDTKMGLREAYGCIAQDLSIILDPCLDTFDENTKTFNLDTCKVPLFSMDHMISDVKKEISLNQISDDHIDGYKFLSFIRKFTFSSGLIEVSFFENLLKDLLKLLPTEIIGQHIKAQLKDKIATQRIGTLFYLLNISYLASRIEATNRVEIDTTLAGLAKEFLKRPSFEIDKASAFFWDFCKIIFLLGGREKVSKDIFAINQYDETNYQVLLPSSLLEVFISFFKSWQKFNRDNPTYSLLKLAKEMFPQIRPGEFKNDHFFLLSIIKKMIGTLDETDIPLFLHYLLFNQKELLERSELKNKLLPYRSYLPALPENVLEAMNLLEIPCDLTHSSIEKVISSILLTRDPELAKLGIQLLKLDSPFDNSATIKYTLQLALELPRTETLLLEELLCTLFQEDAAQELSSLLRIRHIDIKEAIKALANASHLECRNASLILFERCQTIGLYNEDEIHELTQELILKLRNSPELKSALHKLFLSIKKPTFFLRVIGLKLGFLEFSLDKTLEEISKINFTSYSEEQITCIHEVYCEFILKLIESCNRTETKKLSDLYSSLPSLNQITKAPIHYEVCLNLTKKCSKYKEIVFDIFPILLRGGYLNNLEFAQLFKSLFFEQLSTSETMRLLHLLKESNYRTGQAPDFDQIVEPLSINLLMKEEEQVFSKLFSELKDFIGSEERKIQIFEKKLKGALERKNTLSAQTLLDFLLKEPSLIEQPTILENMLPLIHFLISTSGRVINERLRDTPIKQDVLVTFRKSASYLAFLGSKGRLDEKSIQMCQEIIMQWMLLPAKEYTIKTANHLFELYKALPIALKTSFPEIVNGLLRSKNHALYTLSENVTYSLHKTEKIVQGKELEITYGLLIHAFATDQRAFEAELLFNKAVKNEFFNTETPAYIWLDSLAATLNALKQQRKSYHTPCDASRECTKKIEELLILSLSHGTLRQHLLDLEIDVTRSRFETFITEGFCLKGCEKFIPDLLTMTRRLLDAYSKSQQQKELEEGLINALYAISASQYSFSLNELELILEWVLKCKRWGLLEELNQQKISICSNIFKRLNNELILQLTEIVSHEELLSIFSIVNELNSFMIQLVKNERHLETILIDSTSIISRFIALLVASSQRDSSYFEKALELIALVLNPKLTKSKKFAVSIRLCSGLLSGSLCFLEHNKRPPDAILELIINLYEKNLIERAVVTDPKASKLIYNTMEHYIHLLVVLQKNELATKALNFLDKINSDYKDDIRDCYLELLKKVITLYDTGEISSRLLETMMRRKFSLTEEQITFLKNCEMQRSVVECLPKAPISSYSIFNEENIDKMRYALSELFSDIKEFYIFNNKIHSGSNATIKEVLEIHSKLIETAQNFYETCLVPETPKELYFLSVGVLGMLKLIRIVYDNPLDTPSDDSLSNIHHALYKFMSFMSEGFFPIRHRLYFGDYQPSNKTMKISTLEAHIINITLGFKVCSHKP